MEREILMTMFHAYNMGDLNKVKYWISRGVNYWQQGFHIACNFGNIAMVKYIIERFGYDLMNNLETCNCTCTCPNITIYKKSILKLLIECGILNLKHNVDCFVYRECDIVRLMLENDVQTVQDVVDIIYPLVQKT